MDFHAGPVEVAAETAETAGAAEAAEAAGVAAVAEWVVVVEVEIEEAVVVWATGLPVIASVVAVVEIVTAAESVEDHDLEGRFGQPGQHARQGLHACCGPREPQPVGSKRTVPGGWCWVIHVRRRWNLTADGP